MLEMELSHYDDIIGQLVPAPPVAVNGLSDFYASAGI